MSNDSKWATAQADAEKETSGNLNRVTFAAPPPGKISTTVLRFTEDDFESAYVVFVDDPMGNRRRISIAVDDWKNMNEDHPLVALYKKTNDSNLKPSRKWFLNCCQGEIKRFKVMKNKKPVVKDGKAVITTKTVLEPQVKLLEVGPQIFKQISSYRNDDEYPSIDKVTIKIERTGAGKNDTSYVVKANGDEKKLPAYPDGMTEPNNLVEIASATSYEEVRKILGMAAVEAAPEAKEAPAKEAPAPEAKQTPEAEAEPEPDAAEAGAEEVEEVEGEVTDELEELGEI